MRLGSEEGNWEWDERWIPGETIESETGENEAMQMIREMMTQLKMSSRNN